MTGTARRVGLVALLCAALLVPAPAAGAAEPAGPAPAAGACTQPDPLDRHHCELGGDGGFLGPALAPAYAVGAGRGRDYTGGTILWSAATGAHEVHGGVRRCHGQVGGATGVLGFPVSDELGSADGVGRYGLFQRGLVFWTPSTGAHEVYGAVLEAWTRLCREFGVLGAPLTGELGTPDGVGRFGVFERGSVYWTPTTGAHAVYGAIRDRWAQLGWEQGALGYPVADEQAVQGGRQGDFQRGTLRWSATTGQVTVALLGPYTRAGTWVTRFRFSREYAGPQPPLGPDQVEAMADAGVRTIYLQAAADDPRYPDLLSPDLLAQFLVRAHARGVAVVGWYLPHLTDVAADLRRLQALAAFRAGTEAFDAVAVDIEDRSVADVDVRNAALVDLSLRLRAALPGVTLGAVVLPPVVTDVLSPGYWPRFPWHQLAEVYGVWLPMAYWTNRTPGTPYRDAARYVGDNIGLLHADLGEPCAPVAVVGGYGAGVAPDEYAAMARAAAAAGAVGVSVFDWTTTPAASWPALRDYDVRGC